VDLVFSSEPYGAELAGWFGAAHRCVDASRQAVPVAAASIRADLPGRWTDLTPPARAGLAARVVVLGAESTGTTTVARELTRHYRARGAIWAQTGFVPEYGRPYTAQKLGAVRAAAAAAGRAEPEVTDLTWTAADFDAIAAAQTQSENEAAAAGSPLLVCDTDAFATYVWERRYLGTAARAPQPWAVGQLPRRAIYLLTSHEGVPWQGDGLREGDLAIRAAMTGWFAAALTSAGHSWVPLAGPLAGRLRLALAVTDEILAWQQRFGPPITAAPAPTTGGRA
jgi:NadR type nicotinamide-nucleotide adenylyltransferase